MNMSNAEINVLSAGAVQPGMVKVIDAFRHETGHEVKVAFATAPAILKRVDGETPDVVIAPPAVLDELCQGRKSDTNRPRHRRSDRCRAYGSWRRAAADDRHH